MSDGQAQGGLRRFIVAAGLTNLSDGIAVVLWAWVATLLTRDALLVALMPVALRLPWFLFAIPAGIVTDRVERRRLIVLMDVIRGAAFAVAGGMVWTALPLAEAPAAGVSDLPLFAGLALLALVIGVAEVFRDNAAQTVLPSLVPSAMLERANGRLFAAELLGNALIGPALGAVLIGVFLPVPFAVCAASFVVAAVMVQGLAVRPRPSRNETRDWRREVAEGFAFLMSSPVMRLFAVVTGVWNMLHQMMMVALILHVQEVLGQGAEVYGLILAASALGGIAAGFTGERTVAWLGPARTAQVSLAVSSVMFLGIAAAPGAVALGLVLAVFEFAGFTWNTVSVSYRQRLIPDEIRGRVNSLYRLLAWGMMPVGLLLSGWIIRVAEGPLGREAAIALPFLVAGVVSCALTAAVWRRLGRVFG